MRKIILTVLATSLIAASTAQMANAAERHVRHAHHSDFRGSYNQLSTPSNEGTGYNWRDDAKFEPAGS